MFLVSRFAIRRPKFSTGFVSLPQCLLTEKGNNSSHNLVHNFRKTKYVYKAVSRRTIGREKLSWNIFGKFVYGKFFVVCECCSRIPGSNLGPDTNGCLKFLITKHFEHFEALRGENNKSDNSRLFFLMKGLTNIFTNLLRVSVQKLNHLLPRI